MDSVGPIDNSQNKHQPSQPFLTKEGLELQKQSKKEASETEKLTSPDTDTPPEPPSESSINVTT
jgi:hypothetical protein